MTEQTSVAPAPEAPLAVTPEARPAAGWAAVIAAAPMLELPDLLRVVGSTAPHPRLVVVAAHPDDETIGAGRLLAAWSRTIGPVTAVLATAGEACVDHVTVRPPGLAERRMAEWERAMDTVGVERRIRLGLPDGGLAQVEDALAVVVADVLAEQVDGFGADDVVVAAPFVRDPHPDHRAAGRAASAAAGAVGVPCLGYPVWLTYWGAPDDLAGDPVWRVPAEDADDRTRRRALGCFASQLRPLAPGLGPVVPPSLLDHHAEQLVVPVGRMAR